MSAAGGMGQSCTGMPECPGSVCVCVGGWAAVWAFEVQSGMFPCKLQRIQLAGLYLLICVDATRVQFAFHIISLLSEVTCPG